MEFFDEMVERYGVKLIATVMYSIGCMCALFAHYKLSTHISWLEVGSILTAELIAVILIMRS